MAPSRAARAAAAKAVSSKSASQIPRGKRVNTLDGEVVKRISAHASQEVASQFKGSKTFEDIHQQIDSIPKFSMTELNKGRVLGRGQFGVVREISGFKLLKTGDETSVMTDRSDEKDNICKYFKRRKMDPKVDKYETENRDFIAQHCIRSGGNARYACKFLSEDVKGDPGMFYRAAVDLALETHFLSTIVHPGIVKIRGMAMGDMCSCGYFIVMDRLYDTLEKRLVQWKKQGEKLHGVKGKFLDPKGAKKEKLLLERATVAFDLSSALAHLHSLNVIYRDLKPDNIGFDVRGDVKIFDFGLAKELRPGDKVDGELYNLTGKTGSMRYMAPEVFQEKPYNDRADVYSFSILVWEILHLEKPFARYTANLISTEVHEKGVRPRISDKCTPSVQLMLRRSWSPYINERLSAANVSSVLKKALLTLLKADDESVLDDALLQRKSTYISPRRVSGPGTCSVQG